MRIQDSIRPDNDWRDLYVDYWTDSIIPVLDETYPPFGLTGDSTAVGVIFGDTIWVPTSGYIQEDVDAWYAENGEQLNEWHSMVAGWTNSGQSTVPGIDFNPLGGGTAGSAQFNDLFQYFTTRKNNPEERGTRFFDESSLIHVHGEKIFKPWWADEIRLGANVRRYTPDSDGTIFSDTNGRVITNQEFGIYTGIKRHFLEDKLITTATIRMDKNENFPYVFSPAASLVWTPNPENFLRISVSSALRNPRWRTNSVPRCGAGRRWKPSHDDGLTSKNVQDYRRSSEGWTLVSIAPSLKTTGLPSSIRPEQVRTLEVGYRTTRGIPVPRHGHAVGTRTSSATSWRWTSSLGVGIVEFAQIRGCLSLRCEQFESSPNQGASLGFNTSSTTTSRSTLQWNKLVKTDEDDPIIPAFTRQSTSSMWADPELERQRQGPWGWHQLPVGAGLCV